MRNAVKRRYSWGGGDFFVVDAINELVVDNRNGEVLMVLEIVSATIAL